MSRSIPMRSLMQATARHVRERLVTGRLDQTLVILAKNRIDRGGDSTHKYPDMWANRVKGHYRAGGTALRDKGGLYNGLTSSIRPKTRGVRMKLQHPKKYPLFQQHGFTTKGPNYIPFTVKASRFKKTKDALRAGLVWGKDFIVAKKGVTVPQRKIFNTPPEDLRELTKQAARLTGGRSRG